MKKGKFYQEKLKAFTVIEMLTVIAIIGLLSSVVVIGLEGYQSTIDLNGSAREIVSDLRYAQQRAVSEQIKHGIKFFKEDRKYQIIKYGDTEEVLSEKSLPSEVSFQSITGLSEDKIKFNPYGAVEEDGEIILINSKNKTKKIQIKPSGFVNAQ